MRKRDWFRFVVLIFLLVVMFFIALMSDSIAQPFLNIG